MVSREGGDTSGAADREPDGAPDETTPEDEEEDPVEAWAREWARRLPRWSDEQWRHINAGLGYRVRERRKGGARGDGETREPP
jgi:hypothetical protein